MPAFSGPPTFSLCHAASTPSYDSIAGPRTKTSRTHSRQPRTWPNPLLRPLWSRCTCYQKDSLGSIHCVVTFVELLQYEGAVLEHTARSWWTSIGLDEIAIAAYGHSPVASSLAHSVGFRHVVLPKVWCLTLCSIQIYYIEEVDRRFDCPWPRSSASTANPVDYFGAPHPAVTASHPSASHNSYFWVLVR